MDETAVVHEDTVYGEEEASSGTIFLDATPVADPPLCLLTEAHELLLKANKFYFDRGNPDASEIFHIVGKLTSIISRNREIESSNSSTHRHEIHLSPPYIDNVLSDSVVDLTEDHSVKEEEKEILPKCSARVSINQEKPYLSGNSEDLLEERSPRSMVISHYFRKRKRQNNEEQSLCRTNLLDTTVAETQV